MALLRYSAAVMIVTAGLGGLITQAQQAAVPSGARGSAQNAGNSDDTFTGRAFRVDNSGVNLSRRGFDAGARSDWHVHTGAQVLYAQEGRLRYQIKGQPVKEIAEHESVYLPANIPHWHGASPGQPLTHVSLIFGEGTSIKWMEKVSDAEYERNVPRK